ncbi:hypothetical protein VKS41_000751 [Umbelopsis sp. WA50703]|jgi:DnaJ-class molecular chaperone
MFKSAGKQSYRAYSRKRITRTPFQILGVEQSASKAEIKQRYYELCKQFHPDKAGGNRERFQEINRAYQIVSNKSRREMYTRYGDAWDQPHTTSRRDVEPDVGIHTRNSILTGLTISLCVMLYMVI